MNKLLQAEWPEHERDKAMKIADGAGRPGGSHRAVDL
jgi:hypothetical protein